MHYSYHSTTFHLLLYTNPSIFFYMLFVLFKSITPSNKSNRNNTDRIIFIKIIIIKADIVRVYSNNDHTVTKEVYIIKVHIIVREYNITKFFKHLICNKPIRNKFQCWQRSINSFITYFLFLSLISLALAPDDFEGNLYLIWFVNCKTIKFNLCKSSIFHNNRLSDKYYQSKSFS